MTTGYTFGVCNGEVTEFNQFILQCAHAFIVQMREERSDAPIPEFKPDSYHSEELKAASERLAKLQSMTDIECEVAVIKAHEAAVKANQEYEENKRKTKDRLLAMLAQALEWQPPTADHQGLKDFMIQQLEGTVKFDCTPSTYASEHVEKLSKLSGQQWRIEQISAAERDTTYHADEYAKEIRQVNQRNLWVKQLRESLR